MTQWLERQAAVRGRWGLARRLLPRSANERFIDLASNDYLGLAADLRSAARHIGGTSMNLPAVILVTGTDMLSVRRIVERDSDLPTAFNQEVM